MNVSRRGGHKPLVLPRCSEDGETLEPPLLEFQAHYIDPIDLLRFTSVAYVGGRHPRQSDNEATLFVVGENRSQETGANASFLLGKLGASKQGGADSEKEVRSTQPRSCHWWGRSTAYRQYRTVAIINIATNTAGE